MIDEKMISYLTPTITTSSTNLLAYPYSLSYHAITFTISPPITCVSDKSTIAECEFPIISDDTIGSSVTATISLYGDFSTAFLNTSLISSFEVFLESKNVKSDKEPTTTGNLRESPPN